MQHAHYHLDKHFVDIFFIKSFIFWYYLFDFF